jgi:hypothetical protein
MPKLLLLALLTVVSCDRAQQPALQDLSGREDLSHYAVTELRGTRSSDTLAARATLSDGASALTINLQFAIGAPTKLQSGTWNWKQASGAVSERAATFLGGQNGPPSIGGSFDLLGPDGAPRYRVKIPVTELKLKL